METLSPVKQALLELREMRARLAELESARHEPIAIVGMGVRTPLSLIHISEPTRPY